MAQNGPKPSKDERREDRTFNIITEICPTFSSVSCIACRRSWGKKSINAVRNMRVRMDSHASMETHIGNVCKSAYYHLCNIGKLKTISRSDITPACHPCLRDIQAWLLDLGNIEMYWNVCYEWATGKSLPSGWNYRSIHFYIAQKRSTCTCTIRNG